MKAGGGEKEDKKVNNGVGGVSVLSQDLWQCVRVS
jgi:hypothetical protein